MIGHVDDFSRALVPVRVGNGDGGELTEILAWVDTAFNGSLVVPRAMVEELKLRAESSAEAILADGHVVELETFGCVIEWFGRSYETQIVPNDGDFALLGTTMLQNRRVEIHYGERTVLIQ